LLPFSPETIIMPDFCMGMKFGLSPQGKNTLCFGTVMEKILY